MKKYFIAFFLFCLSLIIIDNVYALDGNNWVIGIPHPVIAKLWSCSSSTNCTTEKTLYSAEITADVSSDLVYYPGNFYYSAQFSMPTNGIAWTYNTGTGFTKGYLYAQTTYVCQGDTSTYFELDDYGLDTGTSYSHSNVRAIYNTSNILSGTNFVFDTQPRCQYFTTIFEATANTKTYSIKLDTLKGVNTRYHLMGYETILLGQADLVTNASLNSAIQGSGLATAESVQDVLDAQNQMQADIQEQTQQQHNDHNETMNTITSDDSSGATSSAGGFFSNFNTDTHGLTGIITAPLSAIQNLINNTCTPLVIPLPFVNSDISLPCFSTIYSNYFGAFFTIYQTITLGIVSYWVLVRIFNLVKDFKNPDHDEIEVVDL